MKTWILAMILLSIRNYRNNVKIDIKKPWIYVLFGISPYFWGKLFKEKLN